MYMYMHTCTVYLLHTCNNYNLQKCLLYTNCDMYRLYFIGCHFT